MHKVDLPQWQTNPLLQPEQPPANRVKGRWQTTLMVVQSLVLLVLSLAYLSLLNSHHRSVAGASAPSLKQLVKRKRFCPRSSSRDTCKAYLDLDVLQRFSVILTADPGDFSGTPEAHYIIANLQDKHAKPLDASICRGQFLGTLMGQRVLVVTTGIGPPAAGLCTLEIVNACGRWVKEIIYFGTSGWSPQLGGILNPPNCSKANDNGKITRLGDVCISPFTVNWTCKKATWNMQAAGYPNQCFRPTEVASPNATYLYGECQFYEDNQDANLDLADELISVARSSISEGLIPRKGPNVTAIEQRYWSLMSQATKVQYPAPRPDWAPTLWDYTRCMEVDGQMFFSGAPWELKARDYAAETLTAALPDGPRYSAQDVIAVSAMEGIGVGEALLKYHGLASTHRKIPYTHVRTLSNWLHNPVKQVSHGMWEVAAEIPEDFVTGYGYAIATGSAVILSLYQRRCQDDAMHGRLQKSTDCSFHVDYESAGQLWTARARWKAAGKPESMLLGRSGLGAHSREADQHRMEEHAVEGFPRGVAASLSMQGAQQVQTTTEQIGRAVSSQATKQQQRQQSQTR